MSEINKLSEGNQRFLNECTDTWKMIVADVRIWITDIPQSLQDHLDELEKGYREGFTEFCIKANEAGNLTDIDKARNEFEAGWLKEHPDYYDMRALFADCDPEELKKAEETFRLYDR